MPQSTVTGDTGNQAVINFGGVAAWNGATGLKVRSVDQAEESIGRIDTSVLSTQTFRTFIMEDLADPPELTIEFLWDTFLTPPVPGQDLGTVTITYPERDGETTPATRAGAAQVASVKHPMLANNELQVGTMRIQFLGAPTYTKST